MSIRNFEEGLTRTSMVVMASDYKERNHLENMKKTII